jgi:hypothetical protein
MIMNIIFEIYNGADVKIIRFSDAIDPKISHNELACCPAFSYPL